MYIYGNCPGVRTHDLVGTILTVGMYLLEMHLSHTHSAESSVVSRLYANSLIPVHSLCVCVCVRNVFVHVCACNGPVDSPVVPLFTPTLTKDGLIIIFDFMATPPTRESVTPLSCSSFFGCWKISVVLNINRKTSLLRDLENDTTYSIRHFGITSFPRGSALQLEFQTLPHAFVDHFVQWKKGRFFYH